MIMKVMTLFLFLCVGDRRGNGRGQQYRFQHYARRLIDDLCNERQCGG